MNRNNGFSYVEIMVATAVFAIALLAVLPLLSHAGRNMAAARNGYIAHLHAHNLMLTVRDALAEGTDPEAAALHYSTVRGGVSFTLWLTGGVTRTVSSPDAPTAEAHIPIQSPVFNRTVITVVVWGENNVIQGRAVGIY